MAEGVRLYAGTQHGLFVWRSQNGGWDEVFRGFESNVFDSIAGSRQRPSACSRRSPSTVSTALPTVAKRGRACSLPEGDVRAVAVDPSDDRVVYAGTEPVRLYRSEDGGDTWEELTALPAMPEGGAQEVVDALPTAHWTRPYISYTPTTRRSSTSVWNMGAWSAASTAAPPGRTCRPASIT